MGHNDNNGLKLFSLRSFMLFLYIVTVAVIPLALRMRLVEFRSPVETWHRLTSKTVPEVFAQFRLELLVMVAVAIALTALLQYYYEYEKKTITNSYADYPAALLALLIVLSGIFSPYINVAFWGYYDRAEGGFAYLAYLVIFLVAANFIRSEKERKIIVYAAVAAALVQSCLAVTQFFGYDLLQTAAAQRLYIPGEFRESVQEIQFRFSNKAYGTTYNPNYLGGYMAMFFPLIFIKYLYARSPGKILFWSAAMLLALVGFFAPTSVASFIAVGAALVFFFFLSRKDFRRYFPKLLAALLILFVMVGVSEVLSGGAIRKKVVSFYRETFGMVQQESAQKPAPGLPAEVVEIVAPASGEEKIDIYRNPFDTFASKRGYLWRKSLEMMRGNLLLGDGLDTFVYNFPHWDPQRDHELFRVGLLIDKPHNTYLQIALGVGGLGLLVYLALIFLHFKNYLRLFNSRGIAAEEDVLMLAVFTGWVAYLIQGLSNDSVLSNAPVFWALFGLSVGYVKSSLFAESLHPKKNVKGEERGKGRGKKRQRRKK